MRVAQLLTCTTPAPIPNETNPLHEIHPPPVHARVA